MDETPPAPELLETGRYALYRAPDGGIVIARALNTCEACHHGCGDQAEPIVIPAMIVKMAEMRDAGMVKKFRAMMGARGELAELDEAGL